VEVGEVVTAAVEIEATAGTGELAGRTTATLATVGRPRAVLSKLPTGVLASSTSIHCLTNGGW